MKILRLFAFIFLVCGPFQLSAMVTDAANSKIISNDTGRVLIFTYYPFHRTDTYREQETISYELGPYDKLVRPVYRGTNLYGISWQYLDGAMEKFYYNNSDELNTRTTYLLKPRGVIEFQG